MVNGSKLGGILVEALCQKGKIEAAVIGLGLNLRQTADDFPEELRNTATSLFQVTGQHWRRAELLTALLLKFESLLMESPEAVQERWSARCLSLGKMLTVHTPEGPRHGQALGLDPEGCLLLRLDSGTIQRIQVGDVLP
jgi:BirA family biotin operon repressor/biotin-[acetyl-CoA-carboxylase] ligase